MVNPIPSEVKMNQTGEIKEMSETIQVPEEICELVSSLRIYGFEVSYDGTRRKVTIKGKMAYVNRLYSKLYIAIKYKDMILEYSELFDTYMVNVLVNNKKTGSQILLKSIRFSKKPHVYFENNEMNIFY